MSTESKSEAFAMPSMDDAIAGAKELAFLTAGFVSGNAVVAFSKKDTWPVHAALAAGGLGLSLGVKHPVAKTIGMGLAAFGAIKLLSGAVKEATTPGATEGLAGILPEKAKAALRKFIPTLNGIDEQAGGLGNTDDEFSGLSLDDFSSRDESSYSGIEESAGAIGNIGSITDMAA